MQGDVNIAKDRMSCLGISHSQDMFIDVPSGPDVYILVQRGSVPGDLSIEVTSEYQHYVGISGVASSSPKYVTIDSKEWYQVTDKAEFVYVANKN